MQAVALIVNSPGGSPAQSNLIMKRMRQLKEQHNVPVYAFVEDVAASGGYYLACGADKIFADENSIIGSIGVVSGSFGLDKWIKRYDVERRVYTAGALASPSSQRGLALMLNLVLATQASAR